jgi:hypothetical protein
VHKGDGKQSGNGVTTHALMQERVHIPDVICSKNYESPPKMPHRILIKNVCTFLRTCTHYWNVHAFLLGSIKRFCDHCFPYSTTMKCILESIDSFEFLEFFEVSKGSLSHLQGNLSIYSNLFSCFFYFLNYLISCCL